METEYQLILMKNLNENDTIALAAPDHLEMLEHVISLAKSIKTISTVFLPSGQPLVAKIWIDTQTGYSLNVAGNEVWVTKSAVEASEWFGTMVLLVFASKEITK